MGVHARSARQFPLKPPLLCCATLIKLARIHPTEGKTLSVLFISALIFLRLSGIILRLGRDLENGIFKNMEQYKMGGLELLGEGLVQNLHSLCHPSIRHASFGFNCAGTSPNRGTSLYQLPEGKSANNWGGNDRLSHSKKKT